MTLWVLVIGFHDAYVGVFTTVDGAKAFVRNREGNSFVDWERDSEFGEWHSDTLYRIIPTQVRP